MSEVRYQLRSSNANISNLAEGYVSSPNGCLQTYNGSHCGSKENAIKALREAGKRYPHEVDTLTIWAMYPPQPTDGPIAKLKSVPAHLEVICD